MLTIEELKGRVALVTGGAKGLGLGFARGLAAAGAHVAVAGRSKAACTAAAQALGQEFGVRALACPADVTSVKQVGRMVEDVVAGLGRLDILVNNAGTALTKRAEDVTEQDWDAVLDVDLKGVFFCAQAAGRVMINQGGGKIINVASALGLVGAKQVLPYCAAKGGVVQLTRALALEWARYDIQVNALCPGYVQTGMNEAALADERVRSHILGKIPARRLGRAEEMAAACVFLAGSGADYMTGQTLVVDGGWTCE